MTKTKAAKRRKYDRYYRATALYKKRRWTSREEDILAGWRDTDRSLSRKIHRSIASIQHKRKRLSDAGVWIWRYNAY